jgi:hypothetical protein
LALEGKLPTRTNRPSSAIRILFRRHDLLQFAEQYSEV